MSASDALEIDDQGILWVRVSINKDNENGFFEVCLILLKFTWLETLIINR